MSTESRALLVSLRPRYARMLLDGTKTVELRRTIPKVLPGTLVVLYASSPDCRLVGTATVADLVSGSPFEIWASHGPRTGIDRSEYDAYFEGARVAAAISLGEVKALRSSRPLAELRKRLNGFSPPQSFRYLTQQQVAVIV